MKYSLKIFLFVLLLIAGFGYRYFLSEGNIKELWSDDLGYHRIAERILAGDVVADCCSKNHGYSFFLAGVYSAFGANNTHALRVTQICLDLIIALLIYFTAVNFFSRRAAFYSFLIYLSNPLTSSYTGLHMAEILTFFLVTMIAFLLSRSVFKTNRIYWIIWGIMVGVLLFVRYQSEQLTYVLLILIGLLCIPKNLRIRFMILTLTGFIIGVSYLLYSYYVNFKVISLGPPYAMKWSVLFWNYYYDTRYPPQLNIEVPTAKYNPMVAYIYNDFSKNRDLKYWQRQENKYKLLFFGNIPFGWKSFTLNYFRHIIWLWDKYQLSYYQDIYFPADTIPIRIYNIVLLICFLIGLTTFLSIRKMTAIQNPAVVYILAFFLYVLFIYPLATDEPRHSLIFYPLLMLWTGFGIERLLLLTRNIMHRITLFRIRTVRPLKSQ
jgi:4-amino-4-deoxy-L-arabinose transferase-like glycosyltransferase